MKSFLKFLDKGKGTVQISCNATWPESWFLKQGTLK